MVTIPVRTADGAFARDVIRTRRGWCGSKARFVLWQADALTAARTAQGYLFTDGLCNALWP